MKYLFLILLLSCTNLFAQLQKNVEIEVVGRPTWQMLIPLKEQGLVLMVKTDITKAKVFRLDTDLNTIWEKEIFLDAEDAPKAYTIANNHISLLFSETSGMYYQVFEFNLESGVIKQDGFELRAFFVDQDYVFLDNKVLMAGANEKGAAFFSHNFDTEIGQLREESEITGKVAVNLFEYLPEKNQIESLWSVKTKGYANEKKKKGEFIKDAFITHAILDTTGTILFKKDIKQTGGKFPMDASLVRLRSGKKVVLGTYQSNLGDKGIYVYDLTEGGSMKTYSFTTLLKGNRSLSVEDLQEILKSYNFLSNAPIEGDDSIIFGGVFLKAQYQSITEQNPNAYYNSSPYGGAYGSRYNNRYGYYNQRSNSTTRQVFRGFHYPTGFVMELTPEGELLSSNRIDINNLSNEIQPALAYNEKGAVSYCLRGDLAANNFNIGTKPLLYKLSNEVRDPKATKNLAFLPSYNEVKFWYGNYFIANGSKNKMEAMSVNDNQTKTPKRGLFGKRKRDTPATYTQVRKTIYLTKIASGG